MTQPRVVGGAAPTGVFPKIVSSGIFGYDGEDSEGVFSQRQWPPGNKSGIFFNPYSRSNLELEQPDSGWVLMRRPGEPAYPGSSSKGIVLIGGSMGGLAGAMSETWDRIPTVVKVVGLGFAAWWLWKRYLRR